MRRPVMHVGGVEESDKHIDIKQCDHGSFDSSRSFRTSSGVTMRPAAGNTSNPFRRFVVPPHDGCKFLCALVQKLIFQRFVLAGCQLLCGRENIIIDFKGGSHLVLTHRMREPSTTKVPPVVDHATFRY